MNFIFVTLFAASRLAFFIVYASASRYDRSINLFNPNGDLLQVGYAEIASEKGSTSICLPIDDESLLLCIESNSEFDRLLDKKYIDKISKIDDNVWICFSGLVGDGRSMVRKARNFCSEYHVKYGSCPAVSAVANYLGELQHKATLLGNERPLGVHALICGYDEQQSTPNIFSTKPSGRVMEWRVYAVGERADKVMAYLEKKFLKTMSLEETIDLAVNTLDATRSSSTKRDIETSQHRNQYDLYHLKKSRGQSSKEHTAIGNVIQENGVNTVRWQSVKT